MQNSVRRLGGTRRGVQMLAMAAALGLTAFTLSQCRMVPDNITGVQMGTGRLSGKSACMKACNEQFKSATKAEDERHKDAVKACGKDQDCKKKEDDLHKDREGKIKDAKEDCKKSCYNEGGGHGGK